MSLLRTEVLRYLGYKGQVIDEKTNQIICESLMEIEDLKQARCVYKVFALSFDHGKIGLENSILLLPGSDIARHLQVAKSCVLMAFTLGYELEIKIRYYERTDLARAVILDACATAVLEQFCDEICLELNRSMAPSRKRLTSRYSPGYGDFPLELQKDFLETLGAGKSIGLTVSSEHILIPRKSVTAIAGIVSEQAKERQVACLVCNRNLICDFNKGDSRCGRT